MINQRAAAQLTPPLAEHGEGPVWLDRSNSLGFVDMLAGDIVMIDADGALLRRCHVSSVAAAFRPSVDGGFIVAIERGFARLDSHGEVTRLPELWSDETVRMNDGACDADGRMHCGSMAYDLTPGQGSLYRLESNGNASVVLEGLTISNGLAFSADGRTALHVDSPTHQIRRYNLPSDGGPWVEYEVVVEIDPKLGTPDGICVDVAGGVWVALWSGSAVHRYSRNGVLTDIVELPVSQVTACALGGLDGRTLFITSSAVGIDSGREPRAGAVFTSRASFPSAVSAEANAIRNSRLEQQSS